ncbi:MAG: MATE family efflux transporter [Alphaproteobacteria bacterium]|nr:MATE family efflux transporter [Alphaproteobacteria bacterium]
MPGWTVERLSRLWREDGWPTLRLAAPVMVARAGVVFMFFVDSLMTGRGGAHELAFLGQGLAAQSVMMLISIGLLQGSMVLIAQAYGAGEIGECGRVWKSALVIAAALGAFFAAVCFLVEPMLRATGMDPTIATGAGAVSRQFAWGMPPMLLYIASGYFLEAIKRPMVGMTIMLGANALNVLADGIFVLGWFGWVEPMGAEGAVMTTSAIRWLCLLAALGYIFSMRDAAALGVYAPIAHAGQKVWRILTLGAPISIALGLETAAISSLTLMAGHLGAAAAAAHQLTFNFNGLMIMVAVGLSAATAVRVGHAVGSGQHEKVARAGLSGIVLAAMIMSAFGFTVALLPQTISAVYVSDDAVWAISRQTLMAVGLMVVIDGVMTVTMGALRGMGDVRWPAFMHGIAFWVAGVPAAYLLAFPAGIGAVGLILGISVAMLLSLILLSFRFRTVASRAVVRA